jgi:dihydropteroate synthase
MELERVLPVLRGIRRERPDAVISVDTYRSGVARVALEEGAEIVNDVSGFQWDSNMAEVVAGNGCGAVLMHMRGRPETWRTLPPLPDPTDTVKKELAYYAGVALKFGVRREQLVLDPGFGFGKNFEENYPLLARLAELHELGFPLLSGTSRKSFVGRTLGEAPPGQRLYGTLATVTASVQAGAHIVRVHDVMAAVEAVRVADALLAAS